MRTLIIGLLLLTSCSTFQKKALTFVAPSSLRFNIPETTQENILKRNDSIVYMGKDSFFICTDYTHIKLRLMRFYKGKIHEYYFPNTNKDLIDHVALEYYHGKLASITLITKDKSRIDSLSNVIQTFFKKDFERHRQDPDGRRKWRYFRKSNLFVDYTIFPESDEAAFTITNRNVNIPSWCGTKTQWWYYLTFWHW